MSKNRTPTIILTQDKHWLKIVALKKTISLEGYFCTSTALKHGFHTNDFHRHIWV